MGFALCTLSYWRSDRYHGMPGECFPSPRTGGDLTLLLLPTVKPRLSSRAMWVMEELALRHVLPVYLTSSK